MVKVAAVRFKKAGKIYYFDPGELTLQRDDKVIVETARGLELGFVAEELREIPEEELISPLKPVIRVADEKDYQRHLENQARKEKDLALCQERIAKHGLGMKLVDVEYTFDNSKILFYFTADGRVDFRELVKDLASTFRMRIELRQIGVRDEAKMLGSIGICGRPLCCHQWLPDFEPVSIKMAKTQNLSLNPGKISGTCGRLMCCLKYENDVYNELRKGLPEPGDKIACPDGEGIVVESNILLGKVKARLILDDKKEDGGDKLSSDIFTYNKEDVRRLAGRKKGGQQQKKQPQQQPEQPSEAEIAKLLED